MSTWRSRGLFLAPVVLAAALRLPDLADRPMHADEAIHADKFGTLLEGGGYAYDPAEFHGPSLYYLTLPSAWLQGARRYVEIDEVTLRVVPAALGIALVAAHLGTTAWLGTAGAVVAALLAAVSPAMVFYSRYYIHETPLVLFTFGAMVAGGRYLRARRGLSAIGAGACLGLAFATKETSALAIACLFVALGLTRLDDHWRGRGPASIRGVVKGRDALLAGLAGLVVAVVLFSSFFAHPAGPLDSLRAFGSYLDRAGAASTHFHPWHYYLRLLVHFPAEGAPLWTEGLVLALALAGAVAGWSASGVPGADSRALRFLAFYTLAMAAVYAAIPYKTPWCLLGFLHGMILLAGAGAVFVVRSLRGRAARVALAAVLAAATAHLGWQAYEASLRFASDPRNPYVYAHTGTDVFTIAGRVRDMARVHADATAMPVQVVSPANVWPLPWYLRDFTRVEWWNGVPHEGENAPVILATPDMEAALSRKLYEQAPPGQRELYVSLFDRPVELRPQVELRGYVALSLSERARSLEPSGGAPIADSLRASSRIALRASPRRRTRSCAE
jgi:uncharacterized protein (TIGR03663 family)